MSTNEKDQFLAVWQNEAASTLKVLHSLPVGQYDFRPAKESRSLGEMAWHLAEIDGYIPMGVIQKKFDFSSKVPGLERPRTVAELASGYSRVHADAVANVLGMDDANLNAMIPFMGRDMRGADILWVYVIQHAIHHRAQLVLMCRMAGGTPPGLYGPSREEMAAMKANA